ncbi:branched-chain amino acid ABC transporter permease [Conexibacter sp. CPCC 206217]|uniref:branched-chain amino acid ABC transporter permease n=1 Tax=Conexibacter sp. CPCC 206217 TaxID=3064574 RepID=UPI00271C0164|nr:branched-chain amino acid ABC transporter permease [Conexibacter sp. CPCC 206217]MDO8211119.1 branched-chain amino acid ABC transporter permease [Conexibacter sp. CPCC 206217]
MSQILVNGISQGALYALLALSFWVIFAVTRTFHLAHIAVLNVAAYVLYWVFVDLDTNIWLAIVAALGAAVALGVLIESVIYEPIRRHGGDQLLLFLAASALLTISQAVLALLFQEDARGLETTVPEPLYRAAEFTVTRYDGLIVAFAVGFGLLVWLIMSRSRWGRSMRAVQGNPELAGYFGIPVARVYRIAFALGSALLVPAVVVMALRTGVNPDLGFTPVLIAIIAVIAGGTERQSGAMLAAFALGLLENVVLLWISAQWQTIVTFAVLALMLVARPSGLRAAVQTRTG